MFISNYCPCSSRIIFLPWIFVEASPAPTPAAAVVAVVVPLVFVGYLSFTTDETRNITNLKHQNHNKKKSSSNITKLWSNSKWTNLPSHSPKSKCSPCTECLGLDGTDLHPLTSNRVPSVKSSVTLEEL